MRLRSLYTPLAALALTLAAQNADAGAIRLLGEKISDSSKHVAAATTNGGSAAIGGLETAGKATTAAAASGASVAKSGTVAVARGAKAAAKRVWKAVW